MRKLWVGLIVGLLGMATPAMAQQPGSQDPLSLITSGFVVPYIGGGNNQSFLEVYAPKSGGTVHMFFFDNTCVRRGPSANIELTTNDVEFLRVDNIPPTSASSGLITAAGVDSFGFTLIPDNFPQGVHANVLWIDLGTGVLRTLEPIAISTLDNDRQNQQGTWSPLRTGTAFFAPLDGGGIRTDLLLVCPNSNIQGAAGAALPSPPFPQIDPAFQTFPSLTPLRVRVYDDEEKFLRDVTTTCECLTARPLSGTGGIDTVYADPILAPNGTYTEMEGFSTSPSPNGTPYSFTGYRAITFGSVDIFHRLHNGSRCDIAGVDPGQGTPTCVPLNGR